MSHNAKNKNDENNIEVKFDSPFKIAADAIDPNKVPKIKAYNGAEIPVIGMGTFGSDHVSHEDVAKAVKVALELGYRHFDCASVYGNEAHIGQAFKVALEGGIKRSDLWITSKVWNDMHAPDDVIVSCKRTLKDLQLDYLDLYLVHWPFPNSHPPGCDASTRNPNAKPYIHENYMKTWLAMEQLVEMGLVKNIGTSNMTIPKLKLLLRDAKIKPIVNEMELHPHFQQPEFFKFLKDNNIIPIGYSPIGSPARPERDRTPNDTAPIEDPVIVEIAKKHNVHPAVICIKWAIKRGQIPIPFTTKRNKLLSNLKAATEDPLNDDEMEAISKIDKNCRLIKGVVFLWKENQDWRDLWDEDGKIAS